MLLLESPLMHAYEAEQYTDGANFTGIKLGIFALLDGTEFVIYHAKEPSNNFFGSHKVMLLFASFLELAKEWHNLIHFVKSFATSN